MLTISRYEPDTRVFTVPPGGEGYYFLTIYVTVWYSEFVEIDLRVNGKVVCTMYEDNYETSGDWSNGGCSAVTQVTQSKYFHFSILISNFPYMLFQ